MPIYEYVCDGCRNAFEELRNASDESRVTCPSCGSSEVTRRLSSFATEWRPSNVEWHRIPGNKARD
jgi:putative FmdB family regulatory protein